MNMVLELLFILTAAGSVTAACLLVWRFVPVSRFSAAWRYRLGKLAVVFYLFPAAVGLQEIAPYVLSFASSFGPAPGSSGSAPASPALPALAEAVSAFDLQPLFIESAISIRAAFAFTIVWAIGALAFAAWQLSGYRMFVKRLRHGAAAVPPNSEAAEQLRLIKKELAVNCCVRLAHSPTLRSPILVGLRKPVIYLPASNMEHADMAMIIRHELIHLKRGDLWFKALALGASALHWFNPLVHLLRQDLHTWSELSCDEEVVKGMNHAERKRYGETILSAAAGSRGLPVRYCVSLSADGKQLKRRLSLMLNVKTLSARTKAMTTAVLLAVAMLGTSTAVWAAGLTPMIDTGAVNKSAADNPVIEVTEVSIQYEGLHRIYKKYNALTPNEQKWAIKERGLYPTEGFERFLPFDELAPEEQGQVVKEDGFYSPERIASWKEAEETYPPGVSVTVTHEEDPSMPPGTSMTIRRLTPEEAAEFETLRAENDALVQLLKRFRSH